MALGGIVRIRDGVRTRSILGCPLISAGRALRELPFVAEQVLEEVVAPFRRGLGPGDLKTAADGVAPAARAIFASPPEALLLDITSFRFRPNILGGNGSTVRLAEGVPSGDQRDRFLVIHRHAGER